MNITRLFTIVGLGAALGCGGGDDGGGDVPLDQLAVEFGAVTCAKMFECCTEAELMEEFGAFDPPVETVEDCEQLYAAFIGGLLVPAVEASVEAGRVTYHADRAGACVDVIGALSCADFAASQGSDGLALGDCANPIEGLVADGDPCSNDVDCVSGHCDGDALEPPTDGVCATLPGLGESCPDFECDDGLYCEFGAEPTCQAKLSTGSGCNGDDECASDHCVDDTPDDGNPGMCSAELTCDGA